MSLIFKRDMLPDAIAFYESEGLTLKGPGKWKTTECRFHGGSDSMRVNSVTGSFKCFNCNEHGGDVLAYFMRWHGAEFMEAAEALGATVDDGRTVQPRRKTTLSASAALALVRLGTEELSYAIHGSDGVPSEDRQHLICANYAISEAGSIREIIEEAKFIVNLARETASSRNARDKAWMLGEALAISKAITEVCA